MRTVQESWFVVGAVEIRNTSPQYDSSMMERVPANLTFCIVGQFRHTVTRRGTSPVTFESATNRPAPPSHTSLSSPTLQISTSSLSLPHHISVPGPTLPISVQGHLPPEQLHLRFMANWSWKCELSRPLCVCQCVERLHQGTSGLCYDGAITIVCVALCVPPI